VIGERLSPLLITDPLITFAVLLRDN